MVIYFDEIGHVINIDVQNDDIITVEDAPDGIIGYCSDTDWERGIISKVM